MAGGADCIYDSTEPPAINQPAINPKSPPLFKARLPMRLLSLSSVLPALVLWPGLSASAAEWKPVNPVEIVVPNAPGGGNDAVGRLLQRIWQERKLMPTAGLVVN